MKTVWGCMGVWGLVVCLGIVQVCSRCGGCGELVWGSVGVCGRRRKSRCEGWATGCGV